MSHRPTDPRKVIQERNDRDRANEAFMRHILAAAQQNLEERQGRDAYGEVTLKLQFQSGTLTQAKFIVETILKPGE